MNMSTRSFNGRGLITIEQDLETENSQENSGDSPCSFSDNKISSISSSKRRRDALKRVISVAIKDVEGFKVKGDHMSTPPSDSWAWRKYGQKPIKGSPYPRGYYKCSSSKGCPARKQVERSKVDPNTMVVTYTCEHNHPWPPSNSRNHQRNIATKNKTSADLTNILTATSVSEEAEEQEQEKKPVDLDGDNTTLENHQQQSSPEHKFINISEGGSSDFGWFEFEPSTYYTTLLECPVLKEEEECKDTNMAFAAREDESFFADLGELPECSTVFRREMDRREVADEQRRHGLHHVAPG